MAFTMAQKHRYYQQLPPNCNMGFQTKIAEYKKDESTIFSPVWIWFSKTDSGATCNICKSSMPQKSGSTGNMVNHLKRRHGFTQKPNAWKDFEELSSLKDERSQKTNSYTRNKSFAVFPQEKRGYGRTDGPTDGPTDGHTFL